MQKQNNWQGSVVIYCVVIVRQDDVRERNSNANR
jgi:hypothetical protein